ncbi:Protein of unknown function [Rhizobiales bacterium GAS191]|nr:Protein of unknown function [Rhizobiales bacterium GAS191]
MSRPENFLSRWSRRKLQSGRDRDFLPAGPSPNPKETEPAAGKEAMPVAPPERSEPASPAFDPASLPSIESIVARTDIRPFLQSGVPAELMRNALRRAWATDPAIRDFIGIAENQWDFNDVHAMPGFGPLRATDDVASLAAQMLGRADHAYGRIRESYASGLQDARGAIGGKRLDQPRRGPDPSAKGVADAEIEVPTEIRIEEGTMTEHDNAVGESGTRRFHRSHGRALPK